MPYLRSNDLQIGDLLRMERISETEYAVFVETTGGAQPRRRGGAGYRLNQRDRNAIELFSMNIAADYYTADGYTVEDTSATESYDLRVYRDSGVPFTVEVKGTTGDGSVVELTAGEVKHNRENHPNTVLFVVHGVRLTHNGPGGPVCSGGTVDFTEQWSPANEDLRASRYRYQTGF